MAPRPRNSANKHLPQNLYFDPRRSTYRYRRPSDGKWFQFGTDRIRAIDAAKQLNLAFMQGADLVRSVMGNPSGSLRVFWINTKPRSCLPASWPRVRSDCTPFTSDASESILRAKPSIK